MSRAQSGQSGTSPPKILIVSGAGMAGPLADALVTTQPGAARVEVLIVPGGARPTDHRAQIHGIGLPERTALLCGAFDAVIDGLDPFDLDRIEALKTGCQDADVPRLALRAPMWERHPLDRWVEVRTLAGAVDAVASIARIALLALPVQDVPLFEPIGGLRFPVRLTTTPTPLRDTPLRNTRLGDLPPRFVPISAPPPHTLERERLILRQTEAQAVVTRATGEPDLAPLIAAARSFDLPVLMIRRPLERDERPARSIQAALEWVERRILADQDRVSGPVEPGWVEPNNLGHDTLGHDTLGHDTSER